MLISQIFSKTPSVHVSDSKLQRDICGLTGGLWVSKVPPGSSQQIVVSTIETSVSIIYYFIITIFCAYPQQQQYVFLKAILKTCSQSTHPSILTYKVKKVDIFPWQIQYGQPFPNHLHVFHSKWLTWLEGRSCSGCTQIVSLPEEPQKLLWI